VKKPVLFRQPRDHPLLLRAQRLLAPRQQVAEGVEGRGWGRLRRQGPKERRRPRIRDELRPRRLFVRLIRLEALARCLRRVLRQVFQLRPAARVPARFEDLRHLEQPQLHRPGSLEIPPLLAVSFADAFGYRGVIARPVEHKDAFRQIIRKGRAAQRHSHQ